MNVQLHVVCKEMTRCLTASRNLRSAEFTEYLEISENLADIEI